jgi:hypothetical protein
MVTPTMVVVLVSDGEGHRYSPTLPQPTFADFAEALGKLYDGTVCEVAFVQSSFETPKGRKVVGADKPTASTGQVTRVLWDEMLSDLGMPADARPP